MITESDLVYMLKNLPADIVRYIIASYNPQCFFIMDTEWLLNYDWAQQCKSSFGMSGDISTYYNLCRRFRNNDQINYSDDIDFTYLRVSRSHILALRTTV